MPDYEIRLYRADGTLSIIMKTFAGGPIEIQATASAMLKGDVVRAEVWNDHRYIEALEAIDKVRAEYEPHIHSKPPFRGGADSNR